MYGVCYDDSSQNNIMTDIDKHSQKPYSTPFLTRGWSSYQMPITFSFLATFQSWRTCPKKLILHVRYLRQEFLFVGTIPTTMKLLTKKSETEFFSELYQDRSTIPKVA